MPNPSDNRETCPTLVASSCIPFTGYISEATAVGLPCRPNINDVMTSLQNLIDKINTSLGSNTALDKKCLTFTPLTVTQVSLNQSFITEICNLKTAVTQLQEPIDGTTIALAINLLCLTTPGCVVPATYTLNEILVKLVTAYCNLLTRVTNIETILNI